jgi:acyl carrier protein
MNVSDIFIAELAKLLEISESSLTPSSSLIDFENWDSLTKVSFVGIVFSRLNVTLSSDEMERPKTLQELLDLIESKNRVQVA